MQAELFSSKEKEILDSMFGGEQKLREELPALYEDMAAAQKKDAKAKALRKASRQEINFGGWEDYEKLKLCYQPETKLLKVKGRIHKSGCPQYMMAEMTIRNRRGRSWTFTYAIQQFSFLIIDEEISMEQSDLDGIDAKINYVIRLPIFGQMMKMGEMQQNTLSSVGIDIIGKGKVVHPVSRSGKNKIDIVYWRRDEGKLADYFYKEPDRVNNNFCVYLPIAMQFELDPGMQPAQNPEVRGSVYIYSSRHSTVQFNNFSNIKMMPASQWDDASMNRNPGYDKPYPYPQVNEKSSGGYVLIFPQYWNSFIEKDGTWGDDDFYLSLDIEFKCTDGSWYPLEMDSQLVPKKYEGGNTVEIPCMHLLWGCLEKTAEVQTKDRGWIQICDVKIGDCVASADGAYEKVINIYTGREEILKFISAGGKTIKMTMDHPVMTKGGWKQARQVTESDQICMEEDRYCKVDEIYDEPYYDQVCSLELEHGEGFLANGFFVGDFGMQNSLAEPEPGLPQDILDELEKFKNLL
ncbi:Hint domain-containing protein [Anaerostipes sp.]|uniref:Hint domain-containing protein n=1 Tax=Anaerostipes sp. TaxID=1872530 RepID=UPI0025C2EDB3|nr:Hint domain-containing protein [Anaerostipes sp.]MBS7009170.1 hypothetical protein [Anaerostipes sp.]